MVFFCWTFLGQVLAQSFTPWTISQQMNTFCQMLYKTTCWEKNLFCTTRYIQLCMHMRVYRCITRIIAVMLFCRLIICDYRTLFGIDRSIEKVKGGRPQNISAMISKSSDLLDTFTWDVLGSKGAWRARNKGTFGTFTVLTTGAGVL